MAGKNGSTGKLTERNAGDAGEPDSGSGSAADRSGSDASPAIEWVDPASIPGGSGDGGNDQSGGSIRRGRGRPRGSGNRSRGQKESALSVSGIENILLSLHTGFAAFTKNPALMIAPEEARLLAEASARVASHYPQIDVAEKTMAWVELGTAVATVYGTRLYAMRANRAKNVTPVSATPSNAAAAAQTVEIPGVGKVAVN